LYFFVRPRIDDIPATPFDSNNARARLGAEIEFTDEFSRGGRVGANGNDGQDGVVQHRGAGCQPASGRKQSSASSPPTDPADWQSAKRQTSLSALQKCGIAASVARVKA
jgi:hypothetical protein